MSQSPYKSIHFFLNIAYNTAKNSKSHQRTSSLSELISSCILTKNSSLYSLSSEFSQDIQRESKIKKAKRFLDSKWNSPKDYYWPCIKSFLAKIAHQKEFIFIIDGSKTGANCMTLMISVIWQNYAIPVVWLLKEGVKGHFSEQKHIELLEMLKGLLPENTRNILLGDGEFDGKLLREKLEKMDFEYVLRTRKDRLIKNEMDEINRFEEQTNGLGNGQLLFEYASEKSHAVYWKDENYADPIYLLTNIQPAGMACKYYKKRFKIELFFKQMKSLGFNLQMSKLESVKRCENLIMIISFAFIIMFCLGVFLKKSPKETVNTFYRYDRLSKARPLSLAQKCLESSASIAISFFRQWKKGFANVLVYG
jgi:Transposase DDE domain